jgi:hypothetical protein
VPVKGLPESPISNNSQVATYNARAENQVRHYSLFSGTPRLLTRTQQGLAVSEMHAYQGNLCVADDPSPAAFASPEFSSFDVAAVGLGFHHFDDPSLAARRLAERLKTEGVLVILDFFSHDKMDVSRLPHPIIGIFHERKEQ